MIRALIVDDEEPARDRLRRLLLEAGDVEVVGEAGDGEGAMARIAALRPTAVFLDIQMPGSTGLEIAASLPAPRPHIVFCTAFDQFAVDAFELHAADYLLKPVTRARLATALDRVRHGRQDETVIDRVTTTPSPMRFLARKGNAYRVVLAREVLFFVSEDGLTKLQAVDGHYWIAPALSVLETRLDPQRFFRISRAAIVNLDAVRDVIPESSGGGVVMLRNGARLEVSRRRFQDLTGKLGGD